MFERPVPDVSRSYDQQDMLVSAFRIALSAAGPLGVVVGEFLTQFVPRQRQDRITEFVEFLNERLTSLEDQFKARLQEPGFAALVEEVMVSAARTASSQRRRELASLLKNGMSGSVESVEAAALARLLEGLNDAELTILVYYRLSWHVTTVDPRPGQFRAAHPDLLVLPPAIGDPDEALHRWTVLNLYESHLLGLGLLEEDQRNRSPIRKLQITSPGRLLLAAIDREPDDSPAKGAPGGQAEA